MNNTSVVKHFEYELVDGMTVGFDATCYSGKPVFLAVPFAEALGYRNPADALKKHCKSLIKINYRESRELGFGENQRGIQLVGQADAFRLIMRSNLPSAERLQDWVCEDVLPALMATGSYSINKREKQPSAGLAEFRKARATEIAMNAAGKLFELLPHLSNEARQAAVANMINPIVGHDVVPLPAITEHYYTAGEVGKRYGISANKVGRIANAHCLKTDAYGRWFIDKSAHSDRQVETFRYNDAGIQKIGDIIADGQATVSAH